MKILKRILDIFYISTKKEIEYAKSLGKKIRWYENV